MTERVVVQPFAPVSHPVSAACSMGSPERPPLGVRFRRLKVKQSKYNGIAPPRRAE
ncbi:MAG TPA: hypothetical protein PK710_08055 [Polyangiaceae bacterium]|nr:hypothetical protein [Polyangiaceae bacterium]